MVDCKHMPIDYRHTDKHLRLVMTHIALIKTKALISRALQNEFEIDLETLKLTLILPYDVDLTFNKDLQMGNSDFKTNLTCGLDQGQPTQYIQNIKVVGTTVQP